MTAQDTLAFNTVVVGTDFEACSQRAINIAANLVKPVGGDLIVAHAFEVPIYPGTEFYMVDMVTQIRDAAQKQLDDTVRRLVERGVKARGVLGAGSASEHVVEVAQQVKADLIVAGTHGRHGLRHAMLGSVAEKIVRLAPMPVLTVHDVDKAPAAS